jgi:hypothetical protein
MIAVSIPINEGRHAIAGYTRADLRFKARVSAHFALRTFTIA